MNSKVELVDYQESLSIKVGQFLLWKEFAVADNIGMASHSLIQSNELGILYKDPEAKPQTYIFGLIKREPRRMFLGIIWFNNSARGAHEQNWIFEVYGRKYIKIVKQLAEEMAFIFNTKITIRLVREQLHVEIYPSDGYI